MEREQIPAVGGRSEMSAHTTPASPPETEWTYQRVVAMMHDMLSGGPVRDARCHQEP